MRINLPVSQREYALSDDAVLLSTTDLKGRITYANEAFIEVSGFTRDELFGQAHNLVRHPDMPPAAFSDMWRSLQAGEPWSALVKNRRKDGDHYWVRANASPVTAGGEVVGYLSVRTKPARAEIEAADAVYQRLREDKHSGLTVRKGFIAHTGWRAWMSALVFMSTALRIWLGLGALVLLSWLAFAFLDASPGAKLAAGGAVFANALLLGWWLHRQIALPLREVALLVRHVASGQRPDAANCRAIGRADDIGAVARGTMQAGLNLLSLINDVHSQARAVGSASDEIADGTQDLSARTEEAASSLQETAASLEELAATVENNADATREAHGLVAQTSDTAARSGEMVNQLVRTMNEIAASARRIKDIIGVIDGIAFQTNILALNAAVEAARAGEQGRGFAVVAGEVRALAQRSATAAREIKQLIEESTGAVDAGAHAIGEAGDTIHALVRSVGEIETTVSRIATATGEQSAGIGQLNAAMNQLDAMTQKNSAMVEHSSAAADDLRRRSDRLNEAIGAFSKQKD